MTDFPQHRPNVGIVLFHQDGRVWLGRRAHTTGQSWQFPQGGVDDGEDFQAAALRELEEETGVTSVRVLGRTEGWIVYDFPPEAVGSKIAKGWRGQKQVWFALEFTGKDKEIRLDLHQPAEFDAWRWGRLDEAPGLVIPFKRGAYAQVVAAFRRFAGRAMSNSILMIHGIGCTGDAFDRLAPAFRSRGWRVEAPTLFPGKRVASNPPADLPALRLKDYVDAMEAEARNLEAETGSPPVLLGHSMGGLIVQKLAERGVGAGAILVTPASTADTRSGAALAQAVTFGNILFSGSPERKSHKIWRFGFSWGVLNRTPKARHAEIYAGAVYDSGGVYNDIAYPDKDGHRVATIDENAIRIPLLTIGAAQDRATPIADVRRVGAKYGRVGGDYLEYPDNAHWIIDEPGTDKVIEDIAAWLDSKGLTAAPAAPIAAKPKAAAKARPAPKAPGAPKAEPRPKVAATSKSPAKAPPALVAEAAPAPVVAAAPKAKAPAKAKAAAMARPGPKPTAKAKEAPKAKKAPAEAAPTAKASAQPKAAKAKAPARKPKTP